MHNYLVRRDSKMSILQKQIVSGLALVDFFAQRCHYYKRSVRYFAFIRKI